MDTAIDDLDWFAENTSPEDEAVHLARSEAMRVAREERVQTLRAQDNSATPAAQGETARALYLLSKPLETPMSIPRVLGKQDLAKVKDVLVAIPPDTWSTRRHSAFPTRDLPIESIPGLASWLPDHLREHLLLPISQHTHIPAASLGFRDLFIVWYSTAPGGQSSLAVHTDGCLLSFNILLNSPTDFEGGGTYFPDTETTHSPSQGDALVHDSRTPHAGRQITHGERIICVGFVDTLPFRLASSARAPLPSSDQTV